MKYLPLMLALIAACGGEMPEPSSSVIYDRRPIDVYERTLQRSSKDGLTAAEHHQNGNHFYIITATPGVLSIVARLNGRPDSLEVLMDLIQSPLLDSHPSDTDRNQLYRLLLLEQDQFLNREPVNPLAVDFKLYVLEREKK